jgi:alpha/beta superfamily hydrolase
MAATDERVTFTSGTLRLEGLFLDKTGCGDPAVALAPHPLYGGNMDNPVVAGAAGVLAAGGHPVLLVNYRGVGGSEGGFGGGEGEIEDAQGAIEFVKKETGKDQIVLCGYSFGAWVAVECAARRKDVARLFLISPPNAIMDCGAIKGCREAVVFCGDRDQFCDIGALKEAGFPDPIIIRGADHFFAGRLSELLSALETRI